MRTDSRCLSSGPATASPSAHPTDPESDDRDWIRQTWEWLLRKHLGLPAPEPSWLDQPAIARHSISSPSLHRLLTALNAERLTPRRSSHSTFSASPSSTPRAPARRSHGSCSSAPTAPPLTSSSRSLGFNRHSGKRYHITTTPSNGLQRPGIVTVRPTATCSPNTPYTPNPRATAPTVNPATARPSDYSRGGPSLHERSPTSARRPTARGSPGRTHSGCRGDPRHLRRHRSASAAGMGAPDPAERAVRQ